VPFVRPLTKLAATAGGTEEIPGLVDVAFHAAISPHGGAAFVDFPLDFVFMEAAEPESAREEEPDPARQASARPPGAVLERAGELLEGAARPVIMAGTDLYWGRGEQALRELAETLRIPVFLNGLARGCVSADHELFFSRTRSQALKQADVALVVGVPLDFRLGFGGAFGEDAEIVVVDTIGACGPEAAEFLVREVCDWVGPKTPVQWHGHNDFGMATACGVAAVRGGASWIQGTINGMGERAGNADIGEIALALRCLYDMPVGLDLSKVREVSAVVSNASGYRLEAWKPLTGENLFMRESGAVASQFHLPEAIEPYSSELVNAQRSIVLGKKSGLDSIDLKCKELGLSIAPDQRASILAEVKKRAIAKRSLVTDDEFREIVTAQRAAAS